jgi:hypothetical protein
MSVCTVVDASSIAVYQYERIANAPSVAIEAINHVFSKGHIGLDDKNFIREEWYRTASGSAAGMNLLDWIADRMQEGKIRVVSYSKDTSLNKTLADFGMDLSDRIYVFVAIAGTAKLIVSEDIDFHDPMMKNATVSTKARVRADKTGSVCRYLHQTYQINVGDLTEVKALLP